MNEDCQLEERLKRLAGPVDRSGVWATVEARAAAPKLAPARRMMPSWRIAVFASIAVVIVAAVAIGSVVTIRHFEQKNAALRITDDTDIGTGSQTAASSASIGVWERLPLSTFGGVVGPLVIDPSDSSVLYVITGGHLFKSTDGAGTWNQLPAIAGDLWSPVLDPHSPSTIYLVYSTELENGKGVTTHLVRSDDGGATWTDLNQAGAPKVGPTSRGLWLDAATTPSTVYMYDDAGDVNRSVDRGTTWTKLSGGAKEQAAALADNPAPLPTEARQALDAFLASEGDVIGLTDVDTGAVVTPNGGYSYGGDGRARPDAIQVDPVHPSVLYAATMDGVYKSVDSGRTWHKASSGLVNPAVGGVLVDPQTPSTIYATTSAGIFRSTDGGTNWTLILGGDGSIVLAPSAPARLYASTSAGLFRSDDRGDTWTRLNGAGLPGADVYGGPARLLMVVADQPDTVFVMSATGYVVFGLYRSTDAGNSWHQVIENVNVANLGLAAAVLAADPQHPLTMYASSVGGTQENPVNRVLKSSDGGATWADLAPKEWGNLAILSLAVDPYNSATVVVVQDGISENERTIIRRSTDGGATWQEVDVNGLGKRTMWLAFDPESPNTLLARTGPDFGIGTVHRSIDGGASWQNIGKNSLAAVVVPDPAPGGQLYSPTEDGLFRWVPNGD
jgi:photosystem II stability/assembly factor-like uncharacterized protein